MSDGARVEFSVRYDTDAWNRISLQPLAATWRHAIPAARKLRGCAINTRGSTCLAIRRAYWDDLKNIFDLARYLIAQAFQSIRYPILPVTEKTPCESSDDTVGVAEILRIRHHSLFVPRDFDVSPYFEIIKPTLSPDFDFHELLWSDTTEAAGKTGQPVMA